jgi:hypothetical protein
MNSTNKLRQRGIWRFVPLILTASMVIAACSGNDSAVSGTAAPALPDAAIESQAGSTLTSGRAEDSGTDGSVFLVPTGATALDVKVIRDGRIDIRIAEGTFDARGAELRSIAADLGGYVASGESRIEERGESRYAVGWFTLRIPSDRFETAVARAEALGERVSSSISSQDVSEEFVDLEGRLNYWTQQEAFYTRLIDEAATIQDLVTVQTQMQDVLLNIEQIEGRLRYLESRTSFATLTVGMTEVPDSVLAPSEPGTIEKAFDQAGEVLLATVAFLIVVVAVVLPIGILAGIGYLIFRLFTSRRESAPIETKREDESPEG